LTIFLKQAAEQNLKLKLIFIIVRHVMPYDCLYVNK